MKQEKQIFIGALLLTLLLFSTITTPLLSYHRNKVEDSSFTEKPPTEMETTQSHIQRDNSKFNEMQDKEVQEQPKTNTSHPETLTTQTISDQPREWWNLSWSYRQRLNFTGSFSENLTNIPILINLTDNNFNWAKANESGKDIRFTAPNGTELPYEIEKWNYGEEANIWVKVLRINSTATTDGSDYIWMYYGNEEASGNEEPHKVWKSSYQTVQHLDERSGNHTGSTTNAYNGTPHNVKTDAYGEIDGADYFNTSDNEDDYISFNRSAVDGLNSFTISAWFKTTKTGSQGILSGANSGHDNEIIFWFPDATTFEPWLVQDKTTYDISSIADNEWHRFVWVRNVPNNKEYLYIDDSQVVSGTPASLDTLNIAEGGLLMGQEQDSVGGGFVENQATEGTIDEFRVMSTTQSEEEVRTRYRSEADTLLSFGEEETVNIFGTYNVEGVEEGIPNTEISLTDSEGTVAYAGTTNATGNKTFFVERKWYNISVAVTEGGYTYEDYVIRDYSDTAEFPISQRETNETFSFPLIRLWINVTTGADDPLGDATIYFTNTSNEPQQLQGTSTYEGIFEEFIKVGNWSITVHEDKEPFNLYYNDSGDLVKNITGDTTGGVSGEGIENFTAVNITRGMEWNLVDESITYNYYSSDLNEEIELNTSLKWHERLTGNITLRGKDNELIYGNISFSVLDSAGNTVYTTEVINETYFYIGFNTSQKITEGVGSYDLEVTADPSNPNPADNNHYNDPQPISKSLDLQKAPTTFTKYIPSGAYYYGNLTVSSTYETNFDNPALTNQNITDGTVTAYFEKGDNQKTYTLPYENGEFKRDINTTDLFGTGTYYVEVTAQKANYKQYSDSQLLDVMKIPTKAKANESRTNLEVYWSKNTSLTLFYNNTLEETPTKVAGATATYNFQGYDISRSLTEGDEGYNFAFNTSRLNISTYTVMCSFTREYREADSVSLSLQVKKLATSSTLSTQHPTAYWNKNATVKASYQDTVWDKPIKDAETTFTIEEPSITGELSFNESISKYLFTINTSRLSLGDFTLKFTFSKENHTTQTHSLTLTVEKLPTDIIASNLKPSTYWGKNVSVNVSYIDEVWDRNISNAHAWYNFTDLQNKIGNLTWKPSIGKYVFENDTENLKTASYTIKITLSKENRTRQTLTLTLTVDPVPVQTSVSTSKYETFWGLMIHVNATYKISNAYDGTVRPVPGPDNTTYWIQDEFGAVDVDQSYDLVGTYEMNYNSSKLVTGTYTGKFRLAKQYFRNATLSFTVIVQPIPTIVNYPKEKTVVWGDPAAFEIEILNTLTKKGISDIQKNVVMANETYTQYLTGQENGTYLFNISTLTLEPQTYLVNITLSKQFYTITNVNVKLTIQSLQDALTLSFEEIDSNVLKTPITGSVSSQQKRITVSLYDNAHQRSITDATLAYTIAQLESGTFQPGSVKGTYTATIDWSQAKAGGVYEINVELTSLNIAGQEISLTVQGPSQTVTVDYQGGSIQIPSTQTRLSNVLFFIIIGIAGVISLVGAIKLYSYITTPPEVREIEELIEQVEQENYDYPPIDREEQFQKELEE